MNSEDAGTSEIGTDQSGQELSLPSWAPKLLLAVGVVGIVVMILLVR